MLVMNEFQSKAEFEEVAIELAIDPAMAEKDWYVAQVLALLATVNISGYLIVFSGGTSLSKAHGLIKRFSEDIDFKVLTEEKNPGRGVLSTFKHTLIKILEDAGFKIIPESIFARDLNRFFSFHLEYRSHFAPLSGLRPHIQLEFTVSNTELKPVNRQAGSLLNQLKKAAPEVKQIACVDPIEIAADKLSALAWRIPKQESLEKSEDRSLVRHIHDLAALEKVVNENNDFRRLVLIALQTDNERNKEMALLSSMQKFNILLDTITKNDKKYRAEYDTFVRGLSYAAEGEVPDYDTSIASMKRLINSVLST